MKLRLLVIAKEPVPGRVKTRLCPPCTPDQAATIARAALEDTLTAVDHAAATGRTLVIAGHYPAPPGWATRVQRGEGLGERLAHAFHDAVAPSGEAALLVGMDTPQLTPELIAQLANGLRGADASLGPAADGGWWGLALRDPRYAAVLTTVPMSTSETGTLTLAALHGLGLRVAIAPTLRDVDTADDAWAVATQCPQGSFATAVRDHVLYPTRPAETVVA